MLNLLSNNVNFSKVFLQIYLYDFSEFISQYKQVNVVQNSYFQEANDPIKGNFGNFHVHHSCVEKQEMLFESHLLDHL